MVLLVFMRVTLTNHSSGNTQSEIRATEIHHKTNWIQGIEPKTAFRILQEKLPSAPKANIMDIRNLSDR